eukprot:Skav223447  [mRNA]  locus=scaffold350:814571:817354:- [translate_table: standard]
MAARFGPSISAMSKDRGLHQSKHLSDVAVAMAVRSDCSNLDELPTLYFELDGAEVTENGSPACRGAFMKVDKESQFGEVFILGMPFLRYYFTVFDRRNKQVHIARSTEDCKATSADLGSAIFPAWLDAPGDFVNL